MLSQKVSLPNTLELASQLFACIARMRFIDNGVVMNQHYRSSYPAFKIFFLHLLQNQMDLGMVASDLYQGQVCINQG